MCKPLCLLFATKKPTQKCRHYESEEKHRMITRSLPQCLPQCYASLRDKINEKSKKRKG